MLETVGKKQWYFFLSPKRTSTTKDRLVREKRAHLSHVLCDVESYKMETQRSREESLFFWFFFFLLLFLLKESGQKHDGRICRHDLRAVNLLLSIPLFIVGL